MEGIINEASPKTTSKEAAWCDAVNMQEYFSLAFCFMLRACVSWVEASIDV
jgi:hypothetical protein